MYWLADSLIGTRSQQWRVAGDWRNGRERGGIRSGLIAVFNALRSWRERQVAIRELHALDDRMLEDVGIIRGQIKSIVNEMVDSRSGRSNKRFSKQSAGQFPAGKEEKTSKSVVHHIEIDTRTDWQRAA